jgi:Sap, sulfolipid-1-addressing protein
VSDLVKVLPLAVVMIAGPQILSSVFLATSERWRQNSSAFVFGALLSISLFVSAAYFGAQLISGDSSGEIGGDAGGKLDKFILILLAFLLIHVFVRRKQAEPPKWMGRLQTATPSLSFKLGFLLLGVFPTDILTSLTVGSFLARHGDRLAHAIPFIALTLLLLAIPSLLVLMFGKRGEAALPGVRDWMNSNSWVISEIVIVFFIVLTLTG